MSKAVMLPVHPKWCEKIVNRDKGVEIRKTCPKLPTPFKVYLYCTKSKRYFFHNGIGENLDDLYRLPDGQIKYGYSGELMCCHGQYGPDNFLNGKVIAEFVCSNVEKMQYNKDGYGLKDEKRILAESGLTSEALYHYLQGEACYSWHISGLKVYGKPKELSEFTGLKTTRFGGMPYKLKRAPQSWCYVEELA